MPMEKVHLLNEIEAVFGIYPKPVRISGFPREQWQDSLETKGLEDLTKDEIEQALWHVFPGHYGNVDVFRYIARIALELAFLQPAYDCCEDGTILRDEMAEICALRCCEWKSYLNEREQQLIEEIFWCAWRQECDDVGYLHPFYFILLSGWTKHVPDMECLGPGMNEQIAVLIGRARVAIKSYPVTVSDPAVFDILFAVYHERKIRCKNRGLADRWLDGIKFTAGEVARLLTEAEKICLNVELSELFLR